MRYVLVTPPAAPVVTLEEAKAHLRQDGDDEDDLITMLVAAATAHLDGRAGILGRAMVTQTWRIDAFQPYGGRIGIGMPNVQSITSVKYMSSAVETTWSAAQYRLASVGNLFEVIPATGYGWPGADNQDDAYRVTFVAGYGAAAAVPAALKAAILLITGDLFENRETAVVGVTATQIPMSATFKALTDPYRIRAL